MAQDVVPLDPWEDKCPWCEKPILVGHQLAIYEDGSAEQFIGLRQGEDRDVCVDCGRPLVVPQHLNYVNVPQGKVCIPCHNRSCPGSLAGLTVSIRGPNKSKLDKKEEK